MIEQFLGLFSINNPPSWLAGVSTAAFLGLFLLLNAAPFRRIIQAWNNAKAKGYTEEEFTDNFIDTLFLQKIDADLVKDVKKFRNDLFVVVFAIILLIKTPWYGVI